jgi:2-hydroxy-6-oxonona-2,4-dienedioate hydrolase
MMPPLSLHSLRSAASSLTSEAPLPDELLQVLSRGRRTVTPCGEGELVWHLWGEGHARPDLPPLVLLHGGSGSWTHWLRNVLPLAALGRLVLVPDLPGFGDSAMPPGGGDADVIPAPLELGLEELVGSAPCDFVGFSFGGLVAGLLARERPQRVRRLVLVGAPGLGRSALGKIELKAWRHLPQESQQQAVHAHNLRELMLHHEASLTPLVLRMQALNAARDRMPGRRLARTDVLARALQEVRSPVHMVFGEHDRFYRGQEAEIEAVLRTCPGAGRFVAVPDAGHWAQYERDEAFHLALRPLLA